MQTLYVETAENEGLTVRNAMRGQRVESLACARGAHPRKLAARHHLVWMVGHRGAMLLRLLWTFTPERLACKSTCLCSHPAARAVDGSCSVTCKFHESDRSVGIIHQGAHLHYRAVRGIAAILEARGQKSGRKKAEISYPYALIT